MLRRLGQVPLVLSSGMPPTAAIPAGSPPPPKNPGGVLREGEEIRANGGRIMKRIGFLWFFPDPEAMDKIEAATGSRPSESIEARVTSCIPIPPIAPTFGAFLDPESGFYCDIDIPDEWRCAVGERWLCPEDSSLRYDLGQQVPPAPQIAWPNVAVGTAMIGLALFSLFKRPSQPSFLGNVLPVVWTIGGTLNLVLGFDLCRRSQNT